MHLFQQHPFPQQQFPFDLYIELGHCPPDPTSFGPSILRVSFRHLIGTMVLLQPAIYALLSLFLKVCFAHSLIFSTVFIPKENLRVAIRMIKNLCKMNLASIFYLLTHFFLEISQNKVIKTTFTLYVQDKLLFIFLFPVCDSLINCTCLFI